MKAGFAGSASGPVIRILKAYKDDKGLYEHELTHVKQWFFQGMIIHTLRYKHSDKYRYDCEVEAYRCQVKRRPDRVSHYAAYICTKYNLDVTMDDVVNDLSKGIEINAS
jgi:hypothetical protein